MSHAGGLRLKLAGLGLALTGACILYQVSANSEPQNLWNVVVFVGSVLICPPLILSIPLSSAFPEAAEVGTPIFYGALLFIGVLNAAFYAAVGPAILRRIKPKAPDKNLSST